MTCLHPSLRKRIGLVTQEVQLFQGSVRDNLTLFNPSIRDDRIRESIKDLGLGGVVSEAAPGTGHGTEDRRWSAIGG